MWPVNKFVIDIPNNRAKTYQLITFIILALNFFVFGVVFLRSADMKSEVAAVVGLVVNAIPALGYLLTKKHLRAPVPEISFFISAVLWLLWGNYLFAFLMILFCFFHFMSGRKQQIIFSDEGISYPSFPVKKYAWAEAEQVILKDGILTIDLKNNKLIQVNLDKAAAGKMNAGEFNVWCSAQVRDQGRS